MVPIKICKKLIKVFLSHVDKETTIKILSDIEGLSGLNGQFRKVITSTKEILNGDNKVDND